MGTNREAGEVDPRLWQYRAGDQVPRVLHTMLRVTDFEASLHFYCETLGMKVLDRFDVELRRATGVFVGYGDSAQTALLELTRKWDVTRYEHGEAFGHVAIGVADLDRLVGRIDDAGYQVTDRPGAVVDGGPKVAFVKDPDGFVVELVQLQQV